MRYGYWWIEALAGVYLIIAPYLEHFASQEAALYTDVLLGIALVIWALVGFYWHTSEEGPKSHPSRA